MEAGFWPSAKDHLARFNEIFKHARLFTDIIDRDTARVRCFCCCLKCMLRTMKQRALRWKATEKLISRPYDSKLQLSI